MNFIIKTAKIALIFIFIGIVDAFYLTLKHFQGVSGENCPVTGGGCHIVTSSRYAEIFGIPVALIGFLYYVVLFGLVMYFLKTRQSKLLRWAFYLILIGFLFSLYLVYVQAFILYAYCIYCLISAFNTLILFVLFIFIIKKLRKI